MPRQDFDVGTQSARYVQMRITDNWYVTLVMAPVRMSTVISCGAATVSAWGKCVSPSLSQARALC